MNTPSQQHDLAHICIIGYIGTWTYNRLARERHCKDNKETIETHH